MKYTLFATPGEFDLRSMIVGGMSAKPKSNNPIGRFGSGLKYAIAILLREAAKISLHCNGDHYEFYTRGETFRGETFERCCYKRTNGLLRILDNHELPYTTEQGSNWELWQAFRELYANTMDENGWVKNYSIEQVENLVYGRDWTYILVEHLEFAALVPKRHEIFLNPERELVVDDTSGNITTQKTNHLYFRGMRAYDLDAEEPAMFTYNIIDELELTEDRTIKEIYWAKDKIQDLIETSKDKEFIKAVLTAPEKSFERQKLDFQYAYRASEEFKEVVTSLRDDKRLAPSALRYYGSYVSPPHKKIVEDNVWTMIVDALSIAHTETSERDDTNEDTADLFADIYMKAFQKRFDR